jgi:hypothetical protein
MRKRESTSFPIELPPQMQHSHSNGSEMKQTLHQRGGPQRRIDACYLYQFFWISRAIHDVSESLRRQAFLRPYAIAVILSVNA